MTFSFGTTPVYVSEGQTIRLKFKAPDAWDSTQSVTVQIGDQTTIWYISTVPEDFSPEPFAFVEVADAALDTLFVWADGSRLGEDPVVVTGLTDSSEAIVAVYSNWNAVSTDLYAVRIQRVSQGETTYGPWIIPDGSQRVSNTDKLQVRLKSSDLQKITKHVDLQIGTRTERWLITTALTPPNVPSPFPNFTDIGNVPPDSDVYSEVLQITGLSGSAVVGTGLAAEIGISNSNTTTTNAQGYDVLDGVTFVSSSTNPTIDNGQYLQLKARSLATASASKTITLGIGDEAAGSTWVVTTGNFPDTTPNTFTIANVTSPLRSVQVASAPSPSGGISGIDPGVSIPITLVASDDAANARIKVIYANNGGESSIGTFPANVSKGDQIVIYNQSGPQYSDTVGTTIAVAGSALSEWQITNASGPDKVAEFTVPPSLTNRPPSSTEVSNIVTITAGSINQDITLNATGGALISIDFDTAVAGPRTFTPSNSSFQLYLDTPATLGGSASSTVTVGETATGTPRTFTWSVSVYSTVPPAPALSGCWYSKKNAIVKKDSNNTEYLQEAKDDGYAIGTVITVLKDAGSIANNSTDNYGYGDFVGSSARGKLDSRYPGYFECNGEAFNVADLPDLFEVIGNTYGGDGSLTYVVDEATGVTTRTAAGQFNVPDYRARKLAGTGPVDGNKPSSARLPTTEFTEVGRDHTGGWWYIDKVDVAGDNPFEQIIGDNASDTSGITSNFFSLGTVKTIVNEPIEADIEFQVNGQVSATIGPILDTLVDVPVHQHFYISARTNPSGGIGLIPWETRVAQHANGWSANAKTTNSNTPDGDNSIFYGDQRGAADDGTRRDEPWSSGDETEKANWFSDWITALEGYTGSTDFKNFWDNYYRTNVGADHSLEAEVISLASGWAGSNGNPQSWAVLQAKVWFASPYDDLDDVYLENVGNDGSLKYPQETSGLSGGGGGAGQVKTSAAIDVNQTSWRVDAYTPPIIESDTDDNTETHSHLMLLAPVTDITAEFSYGNMSGSATNSRQGLGSDSAEGAVTGFGLWQRWTPDNPESVDGYYKSFVPQQWSYRNGGSFWQNAYPGVDLEDLEFTDTYNFIALPGTNTTGSGFQATVTYGPTRKPTDPAGEYNRTRIAINSVVNPGSGYTVGDELTFIEWVNLGELPIDYAGNKPSNRLLQVNAIAPAGTTTGANEEIVLTYNNNQSVFTSGGFVPAVGYNLNAGTFTLNTNIKKPVPSVKFSPNRQVHLVEPFMKVKYLIKAF